MRRVDQDHHSPVHAWLTAAALLGAAGLPLMAKAQSPGLAPTLTAFHSTSHHWTALGRRDRLSAGEPLLFVIAYENNAPVAASVGDLYFAVPSDAALTEVAEPNAAVFSVDGGHTFDQLDHLVVARNGVRAPAEMGDVTHVKWRLSHRIEPGEEGSLSARAVHQ